MKHIIYNREDVPPLPCLAERRVNPNRRAVWRGGRRDSDWTNRPLHGWARLAAFEASSRWRAVLTTLHLAS